MHDNRPNLPASRHFYVRLYANEAVAVKLATSSKEGNYRVAQKLARQNQVYSLIVFQTLWRCRLSRIQGGPKSGAFFYALELRQILTNIHIFSPSESGKNWNCNSTITEDPTTPQMCCYILPCEMSVS